jgi:hypothetical protein
MRAYALIALSLVGCSGKSGGGDDTTEPDPKGWTIDIDMSGTNRFVDPASSTSWAIAGRVTSTEELGEITVGGAPVAADGDGAFGAMVPAMPGLTRVSVLARDVLGHERKGDRTLLAARFLPDGMHNPSAASLVLDDAILASMGDGLAGEAGTVDVAGEIMARDVLSQDDRCTTWPVEASQGSPVVALAQDRGNLWLHIQIPNLYVYFEGSCQGLFSTIPIGGEMGGTIDIWTKLDPKAPVTGDCMTAFGHTSPEVEVNNWGFQVWGLGGPLQNWIVDAFSGSKSEEARSQIAGEVGTRADTMLTDKLQNISVFDRSSELELLGETVGMHLCLAGLDKVNGRLIARIAAAATAPKENVDKVAPGAPQVDGEAPTAGPNELLLDANLVGQLLFASWKAGGLTRPGPDADISILQVLVPELYDNFSTATAQVTIDAELPPLVTATPDAINGGHLKVELGDVMVDLTLEDKRVFRFGVTLTLALKLEAANGKLVPMVVDSTAQVSLLDERYDGPDAAIETAIAAKIGGVAGELIGESAAISLPALPGLGAPTTVTVDPAGRFLRIGLE